MSKKITLIVLAVILVIAAAAGVYLLYLRSVQVNYLIPGVPYNGIYNLYFQRADSSAISSVMDILGYWGDDRFSVSKLKEIFMSPVGTTSPAIFTPKRAVNTLTIRKFFEDNGYQAYQWTSPNPGNEVKEIKKFVNSKNKIPVIIMQRRLSNDAESVFGFRVVIGVFDKDGKIITHDHDFGNNYEISYKDFEKMFNQNARTILAVWPSKELAGKIKGPDYNAAYPQRLASMDKIGLLLVTKGVDGAASYRLHDYKKASEYFQEMTDSPDFEYFPAAFQVDVLSSLARSYVFLGEFNKAIKIMNERVLPLNQNLNKPFPGWTVLSVDRFVYPYFILSQAYLKNGQRVLALASYKEMVKWREAIFKETGDQGLLNMKIAELEKELPSAK